MPWNEARNLYATYIDGIPCDEKTKLDSKSERYIRSFQDFHSDGQGVMKLRWTVNVWALLFNIFWMAHRRMTAIAFMFFLAMMLLNIGMEIVHIHYMVLSIAITIVVGGFGEGVYFTSATRRIDKWLKDGTGDMKALAARGGTGSGSVWILVWIVLSSFAEEYLKSFF